MDPNFERTILVNTKFDNRLKELREKESAETYLAGEGLPPGTKVHFISLPVRRKLDAHKFQDEIRYCYLSDFEELLRIGVDQRYSFVVYRSELHSIIHEQLGFLKVKARMERFLSVKYQECLVPTLQHLDSLCATTQQELMRVRDEIEQNDVDLMKSRVRPSLLPPPNLCQLSNFVHFFGSTVADLLEGAILGNPEAHGLTLREEIAASGAADWNSQFGFEIPNQDFKLYGGAAFERLLIDFVRSSLPSSLTDLGIRCPRH